MTGTFTPSKHHILNRWTNPMSVKPIIFLDCDGVLNCATTREKSNGDRGMLGVDRGIMPRFERLVRDVDANIVLSSTWRLYHEMEACLLRNMELDIAERIIGKTPDAAIKLPSGLFIGHERGHEIQHWLNENPHGAFVILDDDDDMVHLTSFHVLTNFNSGLTDKDCDRAKEILKSYQP